MMAVRMISELIGKALSTFGYRPTPRPDFDEHNKVVKNLERAVRITRVSFPDGSTPPTGNIIEELITGTYQEPKS